MELFVVFRSLGAIYTVYTNILLALYIIFIYQPIRQNGKFDLMPTKNISFMLLFLFSISYVLLGVRTIKGIFVYIVTPLLLFIAGWVAVSSVKHPIVNAKRIIYATMIGNGIHALLNVVINVGNERGANVDFFTRVIASDTISGSINVIILSSLICVFIESKKLTKSVNITLILVALLYAIQLATRSTFLIAIIVFIFCFIIYLIKQKNKRKIWGLSFGFFLSSLILGVMFYANAFSLRSFVEASNIVERYRIGIGSSNVTRFTGFLSGISNLFKYPMGSSEVSSYYHNTWLDVARIGGVIPFIFYLLYTVTSIIHILKVLNIEKIDITCRMLFLAIYMGVYLNLFFEPGMEGYVELIYEFTLINGMVEYLYYTNEWKDTQLSKTCACMNTPQKYESIDKKEL